MKKLAVGTDMGGTNVRMALVDEDGAVLSSRRFKTSAQEGKDSVISHLMNEISLLISEGKGLGRVTGIGIGAPGLIESGIVRNSPNLPGWKNVPLRKLIEDSLSLPVVLENDANVVAYGEMSSGAGKGFRSGTCITLGTGVGGGLVLDGKIWGGAFGMGGEVGHTVVEPLGAVCSCGNRGCLEVYSSATGIIRMAREAVARGEATWDAAALNTEILEDAAKKGDPVASSLFDTAGRYLGIGITNILHILNPEVVIIGGGVSKAWDLFFPAMIKEIEARAFREIVEKTKIVPAALGDNAGMLGAAKLAFEMS